MSIEYGTRPLATTMAIAMIAGMATAAAAAAAAAAILAGQGEKRRYAKGKGRRASSADETGWI